MSRSLTLFVATGWCEVPDPGLAPLVDVVSSCSLLGLWSEQTAGLDAGDFCSWSDRAGSVHRSRSARGRWSSGARDAALRGDLEQCGVSRMPLVTCGPMPPHVDVGFGFPIDEETRQWLPGRGLVLATVQLEVFEFAVPGEWVEAATEFLTACMSVPGTVVGSLIAVRMGDAGFPDGRVLSRFRLVDADWASGVVPGVAPVFVLHSAAVEVLGGAEQVLEHAPVFGAHGVVRSDGTEVVVVRVGRDEADFVERAPALVDYLRQHDAW